MTTRPSSQFMMALRDARDGIAAVEFALTAPVLVLILAGAVSYGVALRMKMEVGNAARAGAAYASSHGFDQTQIAAAAQSATALSNVTVIATQATASCTDPASGVISGAGKATACPGTGASPGTYVTVTTQMLYSFILPLPGMAKTTTLSGKAIARIQ